MGVGVEVGVGVGVGFGVLVPPLLPPELVPELVLPDGVVLLLVVPDDAALDELLPFEVFVVGDEPVGSVVAFHCSFAALGLLLEATVLP